MLDCQDYRSKITKKGGAQYDWRCRNKDGGGRGGRKGNGKKEKKELREVSVQSLENAQTVSSTAWTTR